LDYFEKSVEIYLNGQLFKNTATLSFSCSNPNAPHIPPKTISTGVARNISVPENCGTLSVSIAATGFDAYSASFSAGESLLTVNLPQSGQQNGSVKVTVSASSDGELIEGASVVLYKQSGSVQNSAQTNSSGIVLFEAVPAGQYYVGVSQAGGFKDKVSSTFELLPFDEQDVFVKLDEIDYSTGGEDRKLYLRFVDKGSGEEVSGVTVYIVVNNLVQPRQKFLTRAAK
jgi:uncharacterized protein (DUF2141 family)